MLDSEISMYGLKSPSTVFHFFSSSLISSDPNTFRPFYFFC